MALAQYLDEGIDKLSSFEEASPVIGAACEQRLQLNFGGYSNAGVRESNQDAFAVQFPHLPQAQDYKGSVACIADGVSCSQHGQQASQMSVVQFIEDYYSTPDSWSVKQSASKVLTSLNRWLHHHSTKTELRHNGFVTTFSSVVFKSNTAHIFHVGDSRIYRYRKGQLTQLTSDHLHQQKARPDFLTRALGIDSRVEVDYLSKQLAVEDVYLLTTDGIHDWLTDVDLAQALAQFVQQPAMEAEQIAKQLADQAKRAGSNDNLSCLLLQVTGLPLAAADELNVQLANKIIPPVMVAGNTIDQLTVLKVLHSGSRSHVYLVESEDKAARFILKAPSLNYQDDMSAQHVFMRERWIGTRVNHPSLMKMYPTTSSAFLYHLCEYIEGQTLRQWMHDHPQAQLTDARFWLERIIAAVRALQRMGVVHCDLKPENIMLTTDNKVKIIDFGAAQADGLQEAEYGQVLDTPLGDAGYIAPEYLHGEQATHQSDIFSIGVLAYEMLTGVKPYRQSVVMSVEYRAKQAWEYIPARHVRSDIPHWVDQALKKACHPSAYYRYVAMSEFIADLTQPNAELVKKAKLAPMIERDPVNFWRTLSAILLVIALLQLVWIIGL